MNKEQLSLAQNSRTIPHNLDAEKSVLSAMTLSLDTAATGFECLRKEHFYKLEHVEIFDALYQLYEQNQLGDVIVLTDFLTKKNKLEASGGIQYVTEIINYAATNANFQYHVDIILEKALLRSLIDVSTSIITDCYGFETNIDNLIDRSEKKIFDIYQFKIKRDFTPLSELIQDSVEKAASLMDLNNSLTGLETSFTDLDKKTMGFQPSDMIVLAARPSMGKTAFALNIAEHIGLKNNQPVGLFSLEMSKEQLVFRLLCSHANVSIQKLRSGFISKSDATDLQLAAGRLAETNIYIDDTPGISIMELRAKARRLKAKTDCKFIIIDYLQLIVSHQKPEGRQQEISEISRSIKALARELNIPIMILSQLNRAVEQRSDHKPMLSDLRESGAIEQDADVVLLLTRKEYYNPEDEPGQADLIIAKQRNGPTGEIKLQWNAEYTKFNNLETRTNTYIKE